MSSKNLLRAIFDIGSEIRMLRKAAGLSQTELGQRAGLSRMPVYRLEAGHDISLASLLAILGGLQQGLRIAPLPTGPLRVSDLAQAFAHLHADDDEQAADDGPGRAAP